MSAAPFEVDSRPFDLGPRDAASGALVLHGLTGTPYEVRPLGEALARAGLRALGPALPGHNQTPEALSRVRYEEWLQAARDALVGLRAQHERVALVGLSLGGLLSLALASEERLDALAVIATPLRLRSRLLPLLPVLRRAMPYRRKLRGSDIRDDAARARHPSYDRMPLASVQQLRRLQEFVRRNLAKVRAPILIAHGVFDATASPEDAREIASGVGSLHRELLWLPSSAHVVPVDLDGLILAEAVAEHCIRFAGTADSKPAEQS